MDLNESEAGESGVETSLRCVCLPVCLGGGLAPVCGRSCGVQSTRPEWTAEMESAVSVLRTTTRNIVPHIDTIRVMADAPVPTWMPGLPRDVSVSAADAEIPYGGEWFYPRTSESDTMRKAIKEPSCLVLYMHGGAFALCTPKSLRGVLMHLVEASGATVLSVDFRRPPEYPSPVPEMDCLECYKWLLSHGYDSSKIVLGGDSAGGCLAIKLLHLIAEANLPRPAGAWLLSPWVDLADTHSLSWTENSEYDYLAPRLSVVFAEAYAGGRNLHEISPTNLPLQRMPPLLIEVGGSECLRDQILLFAKKARDSGVDVECHCSSGMPHVFPLFAALMPEDSAPNQAFDRATNFFDKVLCSKNVKNESINFDTIKNNRSCFACR